MAVSVGPWAIFPASADVEHVDIVVGVSDRVVVGQSTTIYAKVIVPFGSRPATGVTALTLNPSCGTDCTTFDAGAFSVESAVGASDYVGCIGVPFTVTGPDASGEFTLTPPTPLVINPDLEGTYGSKGCGVNITIKALKVPSLDTGPGVAGSQVHPTMSTLPRPGSVTGGSGALTVSLPPPTLAVQAPPSATVGETISAAATVSATGGDPAPHGGVRFALYGPGDTTCGTLPPSSDATLDAAGNATSQPFTPTARGTYRWIATYTGDANYPSLSTPCNSTTTEVKGAAANLKLVASPPVGPGQAISATATVSGAAGGPAPTGRVHFSVYAPDNSTCGTPRRSFDAGLDGTGKATSPPFTPTARGTYRWVATYAGDATNASVSTACNDLGTTTDVTGAPTTLTLKASTPVGPGKPIFATATLAGGTTPTGTITFGAWRNNAACEGSPDLTSTATVDNNGDYTSEHFTSTDIGTYTFTASYTGDAFNTPVATKCDDPGTSVVVSSPGAVLPTITLDASATTASLPAPGGTFTFHVTVTNTSTEPVTTKALNDSVYGDLAGKGSCKVEQPLAAAGEAGDSYSCSYTGEFKGAAGAKQTDTVKASANDAVGNEASESHDITVSLTDPPTLPQDPASTPKASDPAPAGTPKASDPTTASTPNASDSPITTVPADTTGSGGTGGGGGTLAFTGAGLAQQLGLGIGCVLVGLMLTRRHRRRAEPSTSAPTRR